jgi:hypothetical protein
VLQPVASGLSSKRSSHTDLTGLPDPQSAVPGSPAVKPEGAKKRKKSSSKEKKSAKERKSSSPQFRAAEYKIVRASNLLGDPSESTLRAGSRPPPMGGRTPVEARATEAAFATHDGSFGSSTGVDEFQRQNDRESLT